MFGRLCINLSFSITLIILIWYQFKCLYYLTIWTYCPKVWFLYGRGNGDFEIKFNIFSSSHNEGGFWFINKIPPNLSISSKDFVARSTKLLRYSKNVLWTSKFEHTVGSESLSHGYYLYYVRSQCSRELYKMKERDLHAVHLEIIAAYRTVKGIIGINVLYEIS